MLSGLERLGRLCRLLFLEEGAFLRCDDEQIVPQLAPRCAIDQLPDPAEKVGPGLKRHVVSLLAQVKAAMSARQVTHGRVHPPLERSPLMWLPDPAQDIIQFCPGEDARFAEKVLARKLAKVGLSARMIRIVKEAPRFVFHVAHQLKERKLRALIPLLTQSYLTHQAIHDDKVIIARRPRHSKEQDLENKNWVNGTLSLNPLGLRARGEQESRQFARDSSNARKRLIVHMQRGERVFPFRLFVLATAIFFGLLAIGFGVSIGATFTTINSTLIQQLIANATVGVAVASIGKPRIIVPSSSPPPPVNTNVSGSSSGGVGPPTDLAHHATRVWVSPPAMNLLVSSLDATCLDDATGESRRVFAGVAVEPVAALRNQSLVVVYQVGRWDDSLDAASALAWVEINHDSQGSATAPSPALLPMTQCGGDSRDAPIPADRVYGARLVVTQPSQFVILTANLIHLPSLLSGDSAETHRVGMLIARGGSGSGTVWDDTPRQVGGSSNELLQDVVAMSSGDQVLVLSSDPAPRVLTLRRFSILASGVSSEGTAVTLPVPAQYSASWSGARLWPSTSTLQSGTTWFLSVQLVDGSGDWVVVAFSNTGARTWTALANVTHPRHFDFQPNRYLQTNSGGTYAVRGTSMLDCGSGYQLSDVGVESTRTKSTTPVNQTARLRLGVGRPRVASRPGYLAVVGADDRASPRQVSVSYWTCRAAEVRPECRARTEPSPICTPDMSGLASSCRFAAAPLDQASLAVSRDDGLTWMRGTLPVPLESIDASMQTTALAIALHPRSLFGAVLYEKWAGGNSATMASLCLAVFHLSNASIVQNVILHSYNARRQAYSGGIFDGNQLALLPVATSSFVAVISRVGAALTGIPDAPVQPPPPGTMAVDSYDRSRLAIVWVEEGGSSAR